MSADSEVTAACYSVGLLGSCQGVFSVAERKELDMGFNQPRLYQGAQKHTVNYLHKGFALRVLRNTHDIEIFINFIKEIHTLLLF